MTVTFRPTILLLPLLLGLGACGKSDGESDSNDSSVSSTNGATVSDTIAESGTTQPVTTSGETEDASDSASASSSTSASTTSASTSDSDSDASTSEAPTTGDDTNQDNACADYCALIATNCTGELTQYGNPDWCLATCATLPPGTAGDISGNTVACRTYHADVAGDDPEVHCRHAGPGGDDACGYNCEGFCAISDVACPDAWPDNTACLTACENFPQEEPYDATDVAGDTFACRLYHLTAATVDPVVHCPHILGNSPTCQ